MVSMNKRSEGGAKFVIFVAGLPWEADFAVSAPLLQARRRSIFSALMPKATVESSAL